MTPEPLETIAAREAERLRLAMAKRERRAAKARRDAERTTHTHKEAR